MTKVTVNIPDKKLVFFLELASQLGFEVTGDEQIPEAHKAEVRNRIATHKPEELVPWEEAKKSLRFGNT